MDTYKRLKKEQTVRAAYGGNQSQNSSISHTQSSGSGGQMT